MSASRPPEEDRAPLVARAPVVLLALPLLATIAVAVVRGSRHFGWAWPVHAQHHLVAHIAGSVGLAGVGLLILFLPLRQGREPWAWWALALAGAAIFGGFWLGNVTVGLGEPSTVPNTAQSVLTLLYVAGLAWSALDLRDHARHAARAHGSSSVGPP